jgi:hypothetical protein
VERLSRLCQQHGIEFRLNTGENAQLPRGEWLRNDTEKCESVYTLVTKNLSRSAWKPPSSQYTLPRHPGFESAGAVEESPIFIKDEVV